MQAIAFRHAVELLQHVVVSGASVIIRTPHRVRAKGQRRQESECEATSTTQVGLRGNIDSSLAGELLQELFHGLLSTIVHHDDPLYWVSLVHHLLQGGAQELHALVGDDYGGRGSGRGQGGSHGVHCATPRGRPRDGT